MSRVAFKQCDVERLLRAAKAKRATAVLTSQDKRPWGSGFGASWQRAIKRAGIDKHFHDLRGTAVTKLYAADFTMREIAAIVGWGEKHVETIIDRYVRRDELLRDRIRRLDANAERTASAKPGAKPSP